MEISYSFIGKWNKKSDKERKINQGGEKKIKTPFSFIGSWMHLTLTYNTIIEAYNPLENVFKPERNYSQPRVRLNHVNPITILAKISFACSHVFV